MKNKKIFGIVVGIIVIIIAVVFIKDKTGKQTVKDENNTTTVETTVIETTTETKILIRMTMVGQISINMVN